MAKTVLPRRVYYMVDLYDPKTDLFLLNNFMVLYPETLRFLLKVDVGLSPVHVDAFMTNLKDTGFANYTRPGVKSGLLAISVVEQEIRQVVSYSRGGSYAGH